jgi:hypothetical protein
LEKTFKFILSHSSVYNACMESQILIQSCASVNAEDDNTNNDHKAEDTTACNMWIFLEKWCSWTKENEIWFLCHDSGGHVINNSQWIKSGGNKLQLLYPAVFLVLALHNTDFGSLVMAWFMQQVSKPGTHWLKIFCIAVFTPLLHVHITHTVCIMGKYYFGQQYREENA